ncbi:hypothetical protein LTS18_012553, partial [Coniosporium uncinatum]
MCKLYTFPHSCGHESNNPQSLRWCKSATTLQKAVSEREASSADAAVVLQDMSGEDGYEEAERGDAAAG